jgi:hypothetical protein
MLSLKSPKNQMRTYLFFLLLNIFIIEGCSLERTVKDPFCRRQYTDGLFVDNPTRKKDVSINSIPALKRNKPAIVQVPMKKCPVITGKKIQSVPEMKKITLNTGKENIAYRHNTVFVTVSDKKDVGIHVFNNYPGTNETPATSSNPKPWKWYRIIGFALIVLGFVVFSCGGLSPLFGFSGMPIVVIGIALILKARLVKLTINDSKEDIKGSLGLKGVTMEILAALFTWFVTLPVGLGYFSMYPWLINLSLIVAAAVFVAGLVMCIIALVKHETFHEFAKYGIDVLLYIIGFVLAALLLLLLLG